MTTTGQRGPFLAADLDVAHHLVELLLADGRPDLRLGLAAITDAQRSRAGDELLDELIVHLARAR